METSLETLDKNIFLTLCVCVFVEYHTFMTHIVWYRRI